MRSGRATDTLHFRILGRLEVRDDGGRLHLEGRRQRTLLALLVLEANRVVSTDDLLDGLWGGRPPPAAMATLQAYVSKLRGFLEPDRPARDPPTVLVSQPPGYLLRAAPERIDAHRFVALADAARVALDGGAPHRALALLDRALALWKAPFLADVGLSPLASAHAARLEELRLAASEDWVEAALAVGRHRAVVRHLRALIASHPLRERFRGQLMVALQRSGRPGEALQVYDRFRRMLDEELGIDPCPALRAVHAALPRGEPALDRAWSPEWPTDPAPVRVAASRSGPASQRAGPGQLTLARVVVRPDGGLKRLDGIGNGVVSSRSGAAGLPDRRFLPGRSGESSSCLVTAASPRLAAPTGKGWSPPTIEYRLLGPFEVLRDGRRVTLGGKRQRAVLAALLIHGGAILSVDRLIALLSAGGRRLVSVATMHAYVSHLRRVLEPDGGPAPTSALLIREGSGYVLRFEADQFDAWRFERLVADGRRSLAGQRFDEAGALLAEALSLWRGAALADLTGELFLEAEAARLEELRMQVTEDRIDLALASGRHRVVVAEIAQLLPSHPLRERLRAQLMLALYRTGRQAEALRTYQDGRRLLKQELGVEPGPALRALEQDILFQQPALDWFPLPPTRVAASASGHGFRAPTRGYGDRASPLSGGLGRCLSEPKDFASAPP